MRPYSDLFLGSRQTGFLACETPLAPKHTQVTYTVGLSKCRSVYFQINFTTQSVRAVFHKYLSSSALTSSIRCVLTKKKNILYSLLTGEFQRKAREKQNSACLSFPLASPRKSLIGCSEIWGKEGDRGRDDGI